MSLEAVPCVLQQPDGTPVYGLLIRPSAAQQRPILVQNNTPPALPSTSNPTSPLSRRVPGSQPPNNQQPDPLFISATAVQQHYNNNRRPPAHSSPADSQPQVVPELPPTCSTESHRSSCMEKEAVAAEPFHGDGMELAQLLDDMDSHDLAKILADSESLLAGGTPERGHGFFSNLESSDFATTRSSFPSFTPRPQLEWERGPTESSATPDSGIQSIAGSPSVSDPRFSSPPLAPQRHNSSYNSPPEEFQKSSETNLDFSDMPTLIPEHYSQAEHSSAVEPAPELVSKSGDTGHFSSLISSDPEKLVDGLLSALEPQKLLQFSKCFQAKIRQTTTEPQESKDIDEPPAAEPKPPPKQMKVKLSRLNEFRRKMRKLRPAEVDVEGLAERLEAELKPNQLHNEARFVWDWKAPPVVPDPAPDNLGNIEEEAESEEEMEIPLSLKVRIPLTDGCRISLPPKKRILAMGGALTAPLPSPGGSRKRRRRAPYPWERKRRKQRLDSPAKPLISGFLKCAQCPNWLRTEENKPASLCFGCSRKPENIATEEENSDTSSSNVFTELSEDEEAPEPTDKQYCTAGILGKAEEGPPALKLPKSIPSGCYDFRLPYNIWQESHEEDWGDTSSTVSSSTQPPKEEPLPTGNPTRRRKSGKVVRKVVVAEKKEVGRKGKKEFKLMKRNLYVDLPLGNEKEPPSCKCEPAAGCGESCLNRITFVECSPGQCRSGDNCSNRRLQKGSWLREVEVKDTKTGRGRGLFVTRPVGQGMLVGEYVGEVVSRKRFTERMREEYGGYQHHYALNLNAGLVIDSYRCGSLLRFVNHSCDPNCEIQKWWVNGWPRIALFTLRRIASGEELTYNYNFHSFKEQQECLCNSSNCRRRIGDRPIRDTTMFRALSAAEKATVSATRVFLPRLYTRALRRLQLENEPDQSFRKVLDRILAKRTAGRKGGLLRTNLLRLSRVIAQSLQEEDTPGVLAEEIASIDELDSAFKKRLEKAKKRLGKEQLKKAREAYDEAKKGLGLKTTNASPSDLLSTSADTSYLEQGRCPIGSYDPDQGLELWKRREEDGEDRVRCPCGLVQEEGTMAQCDFCLYWEHEDCVGKPSEAEKHRCFFCRRHLRSMPKVSVVQVPQPEVRLPGCLYYRALPTVSGVQIRLGESCYVEKLIGDDHKSALKRLHENCVAPLKGRTTSEESGAVCPNVSIFTPAPNTSQRSRVDVRIFRVERIFKAPNGEAFIFGFYYARPHETFCEPTRRFFKNELFATPLYDTLPLEAVKGRCLVLDPITFARGRPIFPAFHEDDVYISELKVDKSQRFFEKISSRNRYPINTLPYVFRQFQSKLKLKRDFTPFLLESPASSSANKEATLKEMKKINLNQILHRLSQFKKSAS